MRRLLALIVLLIVPLQLAFAAGAEYCELEKADNGNHFGHHVHFVKHGTDSPSKKVDAHGGCGFCTLGCAQAQASTFALVTHQVSFPAAEPLELAQPPSHSPPGIERPPRSVLA